MQKISTRIFIISSICFGFIGLLVVLTTPGPDHADTVWDKTLMKLLATSVFVILPSFALSVASKYLK